MVQIRPRATAAACYLLATVVSIAAPAPAGASPLRTNGLIAFARLSHTAPPEIWTMRADGSHAKALVEGVEPAWSPDGRKLAFAAPSGGNLHIFAVNADGSGR